MEQTFPEFIAKERDRLKTERETIFNQQQELDTKLADINRELAAIDAYDAAKSGKQASPARTRAVARPATGRRSGIRDRVFEVVRDAPNGIAGSRRSHRSRLHRQVRQPVRRQRPLRSQADRKDHHHTDRCLQSRPIRAAFPVGDTVGLSK